MHVLLFSWVFPPYLAAGASRVGQLVKYLTRAGVRVSVVTGRPADLPPISDMATGATVHHATSLDLNAVPQLIFGRRSVVEHGYELSRLGRFRGLGIAYKQMIHFPDAQAGWVAPAARVAARLDRPDVVLSSSPPASAHLAAALYALRRGIPWVAEYRSPWTDDLYFRRWWPASVLERGIERWIGRRASAVTAISAFLQARLTATLGRDVSHIPNGFDPEDYEGIVPVERALFVHLGSVYAPYPTQLLIDALPLVRREIRVRFLGRNLANFPEQLKVSRALSRVERPGPVSRSEAIREIRRAEANILFLTEPTGSRSSTDVPQKMYEYFGAGRPILGIGPRTSETAAVLATSGLATFADTAPGVATYMEGAPSDQVDRSYVSMFSYDKIASQFIGIIEDVR